MISNTNVFSIDTLHVTVSISHMEVMQLGYYTTMTPAQGICKAVQDICNMLVQLSIVHYT